LPKLYACKDCGHRVSRSAERCPSCGSKDPSRSGPRALAVGLVAVFAVLLLLAVFVPSPPSSSSPDAAAGGPILADSSELAGCPNLSARSPELWSGRSDSEVNLRTGPGESFPLHESGQLLPGERVFALQTCNGWVQGRTLAAALVERVFEQSGAERANEMLTFWVRSDLIVRDK